MFLHFVFRMRTHETNTWTKDSDYGLPWYNDWRAFAVAISASCVGVLVSAAPSYVLLWKVLISLPTRSVRLTAQSS
jgi:hypothetical protein